MRNTVAVLLVVAFGCQADSTYSSSSQSLAMPCEDTACGSAAPDAAPPPPPPPPPLDCTEGGNLIDKIALGNAMLAAANCAKVDGGKMNGYGCFCGSGSTGLDTKPVDAIDTCCQQHDVDWYAICQATPSAPGSAKGCNCYKSTPVPKCDGGVLSLPAGLDACSQKCGEELIKNTTCMATNKGDWNPDYWQGHPVDTAPFKGPCPEYCKKGGPPPGSDFGQVDLPADKNYPQCQPVAKEDMPIDMM